MKSFALADKALHAIPLHAVLQREYKAWLGKQPAHVRTWLNDTRFAAEPGRLALVPGKEGKLDCVLAVTGDAPDVWSIAHLSTALPLHTYKLAGRLKPATATQLALGWALGAYRFTRYKTKEATPTATLLMPENADKDYVTAMAEAIYLARDLINTPAADMLPSQLSAACLKVAKQHGAKATMVSGEELLKHNYPTLYTVGKGSPDAARLVDIRFGRERAPKVTLVGKGVCFDSGGLDIKSAGNMKLMKKDMAGVAIMLALGSLIMKSKLDVRLRVLCPLAENAVDGRAMRPLDVIKTRKGITVEVGDTDAEGRLVMCDALAEADSEKPDLIIDCSTLTGAARVALGTEIPAFFTPDDKLALAVNRHSGAEADPLYRLPLAERYRDMLKSEVADINNVSDSGYAGAITAALYLKEFVEHTPSWLHLDMMAWNLSSRPGRPIGGEAQGVRALFSLLEERYA